MKSASCIFFAFLLVCISSFAQKWTLELKSSVEMRTWKLTSKSEEQTVPLSGASVRLMQGGKVVNSTTTDGNGDFTVFVPANGNFIIEVTYSGCITKRFSVNTTGVPAEEGDQEDFKPSFSIRGFILNKPFKGIDYSSLKTPLVSVIYSPKDKNFDDDESVTEAGLEIVGKIYDAEDALINSFCSTNKAGDDALKKPDCPLAKTLYEKAMTIISGEQYPVEQLAKVGECLKEKEEAEKKVKEEAEAKKLADQNAKAKADSLKAEKDRAAAVKAEEEKIAKEKAAAEKVSREKREKEIADSLKLEKEKISSKKAEQEKIEKARADSLKAEKEKTASKKIEEEKAAKEKSIAENAQKEKLEKAKADSLSTEKEKTASKKAEEEKSVKEKSAAEKVQKEKLEKARADSLKSEKEKSAVKKSEEEKIAKEKSRAEKAKADSLKTVKANTGTKKTEKEKIKTEVKADSSYGERITEKKTVKENKTESENKTEPVKTNTEKKSDFIVKNVSSESGTGSVKSGEKKHSVSRELGTEKYKEHISKADRFFKYKKYRDAKTSYEQALKVKPDDEYAKSKLNELDKILNPEK